MANSNHYDTLEVRQTATQADIKQAYRRLAKLFHPDSNRDTASHEHIARINAAYEVLSNPRRRESYDQQLHYGWPGGNGSNPSHFNRQQRAAAVQQRYQAQRRTGQKADEELQKWINQVYTPVNRKLSQILNSLKDEVDDLAADPFDDELMENFQDYLEDCRHFLDQAQFSFQSLPNPPNVAGVAAHLYHCLNQVGDGIEELTRFTLNYDDYYLHTGQELFRIAAGLRREAQAAMKSVA